MRQRQHSRVVGDADPYGVGADSISARELCGGCPRPRAGNARPYKLHIQDER
ncbi:hypothetical protein NIA69_00800 [Gemmiger formicilis]|nr:hypothetical protein [Gemmiger formicilis]